MLNNPQPFFWNKLSNVQLGSTVWSELGAPEGLALDMKELEDTFTVDNSTQSGASQMASAFSLNRKQAVTTLLDITRANNVGECSPDVRLTQNQLCNSDHVNSDEATPL